MTESMDGLEEEKVKIDRKINSSQMKKKIHKKAYSKKEIIFSNGLVDRKKTTSADF